MFNHLFKIRYLTVVIVILAVGHAVAFLAMGALTAIKGYQHVLAGEHGSEKSRPGLELLHVKHAGRAVARLALGIAKLFLMTPSEKVSAELPVWLRIDSIGQLKVLLWETALTTLMIIALSDLSAGLFTKLDWMALVTPAAILVLSLSLYFMKRE